MQLEGRKGRRLALVFAPGESQVRTDRAFVEVAPRQEFGLKGHGREAIRAAYRDGLPMKAIARIMGVSHQRVSQIVRS